jgi:hypothetical protein
MLYFSGEMAIASARLPANPIIPLAAVIGLLEGKTVGSKLIIRVADDQNEA